MPGLDDFLEFSDDDLEIPDWEDLDDPVPMTEEEAIGTWRLQFSAIEKAAIRLIVDRRLRALGLLPPAREGQGGPPSEPQ